MPSIPMNELGTPSVEMHDRAEFEGPVTATYSSTLNCTDSDVKVRLLRVPLRRVQAMR